MSQHDLVPIIDPRSLQYMCKICGKSLGNCDQCGEFFHSEDITWDGFCLEHTEFKQGQQWNFNAEYFYEITEVSGDKVKLQYLDPKDSFILEVSKSELVKDAWLVSDKEERSA